MDFYSNRGNVFGRQVILNQTEVSTKSSFTSFTNDHSNSYAYKILIY